MRVQLEPIFNTREGFDHRLSAVDRVGIVATAVWAITSIPVAAGADGELSLRGAYYKERSTRVAQPMLDARLDVGDSGSVDAHLLLDAITSASNAAGAVGEQFTEQRVEVGGSYLHRFDNLAVGLGARVSEEPDYVSRFVTLRGLGEFGQKNTTLDLAVALGGDDISNASAQGAPMSSFSEDLTTVLTSVSLGQVLTPVLVAQVTYDFIYLDGYQANPYRLVPAGGALERERVPEKRYRNALFGSLRGWIAPTRSAVVGGYRFYVDDWGVLGHTPEVRIIQEIIPNLDVHARYRFYWQRGADFYEEVYDTANPEMELFLTSDEKLGPMITHTMGIKVDLGLSAFGIGGRAGTFRAQALVEYILQNTDFGNAVNAQLAFTVPFEY
jgi:hypothetical protein